MDDEPHGRKRKGSLRKTVLLGVERLRLDRRNSGASNHKPSPLKTSPQNSPTKFVFELPDANSSTESYAASAPRTSVESEAAPNSTVTSPTGTYGSTTDDDDPIMIPMPTFSNSILPTATKPFSQSPSPPSSESSSVGPSVLNGNLSLHRRAAKSLSPLAQPPLPLAEDDWDYGATEWWGWVILVVTWVVFVVGMGSCLDVWSWAWDVGETPYAPPELEDDPTLPIVGYYPALIILTAVMSWVWVVVAWVGLKYFKHAKIQGEDG